MILKVLPIKYASTYNVVGTENIQLLYNFFIIKTIKTVVGRISLFIRALQTTIFIILPFV